MKKSQDGSGPANWRELRELLGDSFEARVRGVARQELRLLNRNGAQAGRLIMRGLDGAELRAGTLEARIEPSGAGYRMVCTDAVLETTMPLAESVSLSCNSEAYEVRASPLRNTASAKRESREIASVEGNLTGRRYEISLDARNWCALPVAVLLLYLAISLRSRAYRTSAGRAWYKGG